MLLVGRTEGCPTELKLLHCTSAFMRKLRRLYESYVMCHRSSSRGHIIMSVIVTVTEYLHIPYTGIARKLKFLVYIFAAIVWIYLCQLFVISSEIHMYCALECIMAI